MTFKEFMKEVGYDLMTTFWEDFSIADKYGIAGVKDTYKRAFDERCPNGVAEDLMYNEENEYN